MYERMWVEYMCDVGGVSVCFPHTHFQGEDNNGGSGEIEQPALQPPSAQSRYSCPTACSVNLSSFHYHSLQPTYKVTSVGC